MKLDVVIAECKACHREQTFPLLVAIDATAMPRFLQSSLRPCACGGGSFAIRAHVKQESN